MQWQARGVAMQHLPGVVLIGALCLLFPLCLTLCLNPGQPLDPILQAAKPLVGAAVNQKISVPTTGTYLVYGRSGHMVFPDTLGYLLLLGVIGVVNLLSLNRCQSGLLANHHRGILLCSLSRFSDTPKM